MNALALTVILQADGAAPGAPSPFGFMLPMLLIFGIFYFLMIRPQAKRQREHEAMLKAVGRGDRVVTTGGLHGTIVGESEEVLTLEIAMAGKERVRVKLDRRGIERLLEKAKGGVSE
ncbi:MAG: preprotein translocase subunit YajC [Myxococcota bacterium]|nr:preprotein translocase subunit YajC [Myxococcota bacterium]